MPKEKEKVEELELQPEEEPKAEKPKKMKYRYFCPACTGVAFYSNKKEKRGAVICANCGKEIIADKLENYIKV